MKKIPFILLSESDGSPVVGASENINVRINKDGDGFYPATNAAEEFSPGYYSIELTDSELKCEQFVVVEISCTGAQRRVFSYTPEGIEADAQAIAEAVWNSDSTITAQDIWEYGSRTLTQYSPDIAPDDVAGSVYCTRSDVERRWGINNVRQWSDLENDGDEAKIQTQMDWAILAASERINSDLAASVYKLPFDPVPYAVRRFAATLAGVELFNTRAVNISREQSNGEIRTALADYSNWITSVLSNVPIVGATLK